MGKSDRDQIQERMAIYANAIDRKDFAAIARCFLPDAEIEYAGFSNRLRGHEAITGHMRLALEPLDAMQHLFGNFIIDTDSNAARLTCDIIAQHIRQGLHGGDSFMAGGKYEVQLRQASGIWLIERIAATTIWSTGNRDLLPKTAN